MLPTPPRPWCAAEWEWILTLAVAPLLLFPLRWPTGTLGALVLVGATWMAGLLWGRTALLPFPYWPPAAVLVGLAFVGAWLSAAPDLAIPKLVGLLLGIIVVRSVVLTSNERYRLWCAVAVYVMCGVGFAIGGVLSTRWTSKLPYLGAIVPYLPSPVVALPEMPNGANMNALGGSTLLFIPVVGCLTIGLWRLREPLVLCWPPQWRHGPGEKAHRAVRWVLASLTLSLVGLLVLSQSRTAWAGLLVTFAVLASGRWRYTIRLGLVLLAMLALLVSSPGAPTWPGNGSVVETSIDARSELWRHAVYAIQDFPWVGLGLGTFRRAVQVLYPLSQPLPEADIAHAHNVFLQTALDVGLPGLVAYVAILMLGLGLCCEAHRWSGASDRWLVAGLAGNLVAVHVFGLGDAIAIGAKVGVFYWYSLGLIAAVHTLLRKEQHAHVRIQRDCVDPASMILVRPPTSDA